MQCWAWKNEILNIIIRPTTVRVQARVSQSPDSHLLKQFWLTKPWNYSPRALAFFFVKLSWPNLKLKYTCASDQRETNNLIKSAVYSAPSTVTRFICAISSLDHDFGVKIVICCNLSTMYDGSLRLIMILKLLPHVCAIPDIGKLAHEKKTAKKLQFLW